MPQSLYFDCQRENQPSAADPLDRATWAALRIYANGKCLTRLFDRQTKEPRDTVYVPTFPLARWIVGNWWSLLHEPATLDDPPPPNPDLSSARAWLRRHCLRSAEAGLLLPRAFLYSDGRAVRVRWQADPEDAFPTLPGYFQFGSRVVVEREDAEGALREFVSTVLSWIRDVNDERANRLRDAWSAITGADESERAFCRAAARMGLDPYTTEEWTPALVQLLETGFGEDPDVPLVEDALESSNPSNAVAIWSWVSAAKKSFDLQRAPTAQMAGPPVVRTGFAAPRGYGKAAEIRSSLSLPDNEPLHDVATVGEALGIGPMPFEQRDSPSPDVQGAVGWRSGHTPVFAGASPVHPHSRRFLEARAMYLAAYACGETARLITRSKTWDQQASRTFAAELLMPRSTVARRLDGAADEEERTERINDLSREYHVSSWVVEMQRANGATPVPAW